MPSTHKIAPRSEKSAQPYKREPHTLTSYTSLSGPKSGKHKTECFIDMHSSSKSLEDRQLKSNFNTQLQKGPTEAPFVINEDLINEVDSPVGKFNPNRVYEDLVDGEMSQSLENSQSSGKKSDHDEGKFDYLKAYKSQTDKMVSSYFESYNQQSHKPQGRLNEDQAEEQDEEDREHLHFMPEFYSKFSLPKNSSEGQAPQNWYSSRQGINPPSGL